MDEFTANIEAVRKHFNLEKVNILGHSWGGLLAMWYASTYPAKLESLALAGSIPANKEYEMEAMERNQANKSLLRWQEVADIFSPFSQKNSAMKETLL